MPASHTHSALRRRQLTANAALACALLVCLTLAALQPTRYHFYPLCPIHEYLGLLCPGCGSTRALAALLRGHLLDAWHQNALFVLLLPFAIAVAARAYLRAIRPGEFRWPRIPSPALAAALLTTAAFTIARNIAHWPA